MAVDGSAVLADAVRELVRSRADVLGGETH
jgi:hypothetical protein